DSAEVVTETDSEFKDGKYGKSYEDVRKEQSLDNNDGESDHDNDESDTESTGHEQSPNIDKPYNPNDPNHRE
ncbi:zinc metalloprotease, partial [Staphylococcus lugdunensis]